MGMFGIPYVRANHGQTEADVIAMEGSFGTDQFCPGHAIFQTWVIRTRGIAVAPGQSVGERTKSGQYVSNRSGFLRFFGCEILRDWMGLGFKKAIAVVNGSQLSQYVRKFAGDRIETCLPTLEVLA